MNLEKLIDKNGSLDSNIEDILNDIKYELINHKMSHGQKLTLVSKLFDIEKHFVDFINIDPQIISKERLNNIYKDYVTTNQLKLLHFNNIADCVNLLNNLNYKNIDFIRYDYNLNKYQDATNTNILIEIINRILNDIKYA